MKPQSQLFELLVDGVPYEVKATPFAFNTETRFNVQFNGSPEYVFVWDGILKRFVPIGDGAGLIPDNLELEVAEKLQDAVSA